MKGIEIHIIDEEYPYLAQDLTIYDIPILYDIMRKEKFILVCDVIFRTKDIKKVCPAV